MALFESKFQGGFIGDTMGMRKTLTSILVMIASILAEREKPTSKKGPWVVVTKKSLIPNWLREISENMSKDAGIRVLALTPKVSRLLCRSY
jgi:SNF2 family DNA or RNA helicase